MILYETSDKTDKSPKIRAATIEKLIEKVTFQNSEPSLQKTFLLTYRSIITPSELLNLLILRYSMPLPEGSESAVASFKLTRQKPVQLKVCQLLKTWIQRHFYDFEADVELQEKFHQFAVDTITPQYPIGGQLVGIFERQKSGNYGSEKKAHFTEPPPKPIVPSKKDPQLLDLNAKELARALS